MSEQYEFNKAMSRNAGTWTEALQGILKDKKRLKNKRHLMTSLEANDLGIRIKASVDLHHGAIREGAINVFDVNLQNYREKKQELGRAIGKEEMSWDAGKMRNELGYVKMLVESATVESVTLLEGKRESSIDKIRKIYTQGILSGDRHRSRAACEAVLGCDLVNTVPKEDQPGAHKLVKQAEEALTALRQDKGIDRAGAALRGAGNSLLKSRDVLNQASLAIHGEDLYSLSSFILNDLSKAFRRIEFDEGGQIEVLPADHVNVTGIVVPVDEMPMAGG